MFKSNIFGKKLAEVMTTLCSQRFEKIEMVLVWFGVTGSEVMFLCLHTFLFYSNLIVTVVHLLNIRSRQHSAQLIKDFYLESRRFVMVRDSAYVVPS